MLKGFRGFRTKFRISVVHRVGMFRATKLRGRFLARRDGDSRGMP